MSYTSSASNEDLAQKADAIAFGKPSLLSGAQQRDVPAEVRTLGALVAELFRRLAALEDTSGEADSDGSPASASP